jgi:hypothetical protein
MAYSQSAALTGSSNYLWLTLYDGTTAQCSIVFRSDGAILLTSGAASGTTLDTYTSAVTATNTWFAFEFEIIINNTTGRFRVRKNGNNVDDHDSGASLNTRGGTSNAYANKLSWGNQNVSGQNAWLLDDILWRSDSSSVPWVGDVRCYTRMPATDSAVQFSPSSTTCPVTPFVQGTTLSITNGVPKYVPFVATCSGTIGTASVSLGTGYTGNMKCTLFNDNSGAVGTVLASATTISNPVAGSNTFTFGSPPSVVAGTQYWIGFASDTTSGSWNVTTSTGGSLTYPNSGATASVAYASFPTANPSLTTGQQAVIFTATITPTTANNAMLVAEVAEDQAGTYVYDSTVGHADLYTPQAISVTPATTVAVVTRAFALKTDAGTRNIALQVKSGGTTSTGTSTALNTVWGWLSKVDQVDPATSAAWTATAVNNLTFGPSVSA